MMAVAPASAAVPSDIMRMFREWEWLRAEEETYAELLADTPESAEATERVLAVEERVAALVPTDARDFVAKVLVMTVNGSFRLTCAEDDPEFWAQARGLIETAA